VLVAHRYLHSFPTRRSSDLKGLYALSDAIGLFARSAELIEATGALWFIENPVSTLATYWRKPYHVFQPWQFAHIDPAANYTKTRSEEHTSELQSRENLVCRL